MRRHIRFLPSAVVYLIASTSCYHLSIKPIETDSSPPEYRRIFVRNYELGEQRTAFVGQAIIKVKDYYMKTVKLKSMQPTADFSVSYSPIKAKYNPIHTGTKDSNYPILGTTTLANRQWSVIEFMFNNPNYQLDFPMPVLPKSRMLIDSDGRPYPKIWSAHMSRTAAEGSSIAPESIRFAPAEMQLIAKERGYANYELIYSGRDSSSLTLTYREYTADDMARPAFFQNLLYDPNSANIRFKNTKIQIHEVTGEAITYTVLEDGILPSG